MRERRPKAKPWKGLGPGVFEIVVATRLSDAMHDYEERYGKETD